MESNQSTKGPPNKYTKITVVGDGGIGKTNLAVSFLKSEFLGEHVPTVFDSFNTHIEVDGTQHTVTLWDTAGQEDFRRLRPLAYPNTAAFLLCFAINSKDSFDNVKNCWISELREHVQEARIILVGTKVDLRPPHLSKPNAKSSEDFVTPKEGKRMMKAVNADMYLECSAKTRQGVQEVFQETMRCILGTTSNANTKTEGGLKCTLI